MNKVQKPSDSEKLKVFSRGAEIAFFVACHIERWDGGNSFT
jgi:hypothetical protein